MSEEMSKENRDWLDSLAGKRPADADPVVLAQALAVRKALASRREEIEAEAARVGHTGLDEIRARLKREGLMDAYDRAEQGDSWWGRIKSLFGIGSAMGTVKHVPVWGLAGALALTIMLAMQLPQFEPDETMIVRGDSHATTLIVGDPEARANEILVGIKAFSPDAVQMARLGDGSIQLLIRDSQAVQDYLLEHRIEAIAVEGNVKILVVPLEK